MEQVRVLDKQQTLSKIKRIAFEIYENNFQEQTIVIAGIYDKGYIFAELIAEEVRKIAKLDVLLVKITLDKLASIQSDVMLDADLNVLADKVVVLCDDVMNSGRAMAFSMKPFLNQRIKKLQTAVIVDREHKNFPIYADYVGYRVATTLKETINVVLDNEEGFGVYMY